jgi:anthranilate synthase component 1
MCWHPIEQGEVSISPSKVAPQAERLSLMKIEDGRFLLSGKRGCDMPYPTLEQALEKAEGFDFVPVAMDEPADTETPVSVFMRFKDTSPYCFLLDSVEGGEKWARYSFIGRDPLVTIRIRDGSAVLAHRGGAVEKIEGNPFDIVRAALGRFRGAKVEGLPRFTGGAVGYFGYDTARSVEHLPNPPPDDAGLPDCHFIVADEVLAFDHLKQKLVLIVNMPTAGDLALNYRRACERLEALSRALHTSRWMAGGPEHVYSPAAQAEPECNMSREYYCGMVRRAKEYILDGDIFQVVLSQRLTLGAPGDPFEVYRRLRLSNPSPYMFFLKFDDYCIAGASPEMLARVEGGFAETCPIAGTRRRGKTPEEDAALEAELADDEKENAEHMMLVDLGRNDLGRVSEFGSVHLTELKKIQRYSHVMHLSSTVRGKLRAGLTAFDALKAVLPAGTLSGAPKIRAMQIIDELEPTRRGPYGGAAGYIGFDGSLDCCITIRAVIFKDGLARVQAGAGIVADSVPENEYEESLNKAGALLQALREAGGRP